MAPTFRCSVFYKEMLIWCIQSERATILWAIGWFQARSRPRNLFVKNVFHIFSTSILISCIFNFGEYFTLVNYTSRGVTICQLLPIQYHLAIPFRTERMWFCCSANNRRDFSIFASRCRVSSSSVIVFFLTIRPWFLFGQFISSCKFLLS